MPNVFFFQNVKASSHWCVPIRSFPTTSLSLLHCNSVVAFAFFGANNDGHRFPTFQFVLLMVITISTRLWASLQHAAAGRLFFLVKPCCRICRCFCNQKTNALSSKTITSFGAFQLTHFNGLGRCAVSYGRCASEQTLLDDTASVK